MLSAPFMGEVRRWIRLEFPGQFVAIVGGAVALAAVGAIGWALIRIREQRAARYGLVVAAAAIAVTYARWSALGNVDSDVVERVHFIEYGTVSWLFYRAWLPVGGVSVVVLAFVSALTVGTFEEWFQWFIPARVGEVRDIALNSAAIVCGLLVGVAVRPPGRRRAPLGRVLASCACTTAIACAALGGFVDAAHIGHEIADAEIGMFRSIYSPTDLRALSADRAARWATDPPRVRPARVSREDQYASEGLLHVQERNTRWTSGDVRAAWGENQILERYFSPVLDAPSYVSPTGHRWAAEQRADAERRVGARPDDAIGTRPAPAFVSHAEGAFPIWPWPRWRCRLFAAVIVSALLAVAVVSGRRSGGG